MPLDFSKFKFPSDKITIGTLRKMHPNDFDATLESCAGVFGDMGPDGESQTSHDMNNMLYSERVYAECAWVKAKGDTYDRNWMDDSARHLKELYVKYDLASGPQHAEQLIRSIESQAQAAAKQLPGH